MMDEQLIDEVAHHAVIYNRQKYYLNGGNGGNGGGNKYETKDEAWQVIAMKLRSDVETCKKRWKYLRERYVSQRKQGDPPVYEHLSRPYLEKMKFLDQHIQPRKSYRNVPNFLTSPHSANSSNFNDYNMDSKSNSSMKNLNHFGSHSHHYHQQSDQQHAMNALSSAAVAASALENDNRVKIEADQVFRDFAAAVASQQLQQISQSQMQQQAAAVAAAMADSSPNYTEHFRDTTQQHNALSGISNPQTNLVGNGGLPSSSSSIKSPLSSPIPGGNHNGTTNPGHSSTPQQTVAHSSSSAHSTTAINQHGVSNHNFNESQNEDLDSSTSSNYHMKKPRVQLNNSTNSMNASSQHNNNNNTNGQLSNSHNSMSVSSHFVDDTDDDSDDNDNSSVGMLQPQAVLNESAENPFSSISASTSTVALQQRQNNNNNNINSQLSNQASNMFPSNADFLLHLYQQLPQQQQQQNNVQQNHQFSKFQVPQTPPPPQRSSEHLLGELVTTELLKMSKERRKNVQKRILEILFFDD